MGGKYNPQSPDNYPVSWLSAANNALAVPGTWVSIDWSRGEAGAVARMKRLRAFRDGITLFPGRAPALARALSEGKTLAFRKVAVHGVWDVQVRVQDAAGVCFEVVK